MKQSVLVVGSGGREHALARRIAVSKDVDRVFIAPGNGGTPDCGENIPINAHEINKLAQFARDNHISFTVVGPDEPLALGIVDCFTGNNPPIFGPTRGAAQTESSKIFAKQLMQRKGILTAPFQICDSYQDAWKTVWNRRFPFVVKADGLAGGKGAYVCYDISDTKTALQELMIDRRFGSSGDRVIIEDFIPGWEVSIHALVDKHNIIMFPPARDYKTIHEGGEGPNTGGMGCIAPLSDVSDRMMEEIRDTIIVPVLEGLRELGIIFRGLLYPGLKITSSGNIYVLEINVRFGDPETLVLLELMDADLFHVLEACAYDRLDEVRIEWRNNIHSVCVTLCSAGYPSRTTSDVPIRGIEVLEKIPGITVYHGGTVYNHRENNYYALGGKRVLYVVSCGTSIEKVQQTIYNAIPHVDFDGMYYRRDIGISV